MTDYCPEKSLPQVGLVQSGLTVDSALCKDLLAAFTEMKPASLARALLNHKSNVVNIWSSKVRNL